MTTTQSIQALLPAGYTARERIASRGAIGAVPTWIITGKWGDEATITDESQVERAIAKIDADYAARTAPQAPATQVEATPAPATHYQLSQSSERAVAARDRSRPGWYRRGQRAGFGTCWSCDEPLTNAFECPGCGSRQTR